MVNLKEEWDKHKASKSEEPKTQVEYTPEQAKFERDKRLILENPTLNKKEYVDFLKCLPENVDKVLSEKPITRKDATKKALEMAGINIDSVFTRRGQVQSLKVDVELPNDKLISDFAKEIVEILKDKNKLFFRVSSKDIVEITKYKDKQDQEILIFRELSPERFITHIETFIRPINIVKLKNGSIMEIEKSMSSNLSKIILKSEVFENSLPKIKRIFPVQIPIIYNNKLTFPKKGYDKRFESFTPFESPEIDINLSLDKAKETLNYLYSEFCFENEQSKVNAIGNLLTPFLRGLFSKFNIRTPVVFYIANRERAGKDYCADIVGIVYEGFAMQEPPISTGEKSGNNNEELRKKILSSLLAGRRRLHFANNKGYLNNSVFEGVITTEKYSDRILGRNEILTFDNEIDYSLSGNVGIGFTPDIMNRAIFVKLFLDIEDANSRKFNNPNLHKWVLENRSLILSSLYSLIRNWFDKGCPKSSIPFTSFPEWSEICGGIMESAELGNPCIKNDESITIGGDIETKDMKSLFEGCFEKYPGKWITKEEIKQVIEEYEIFQNLDFTQRSSQTIFGNTLKRYIGRVLSNIVLSVDNVEKRPSRHKYKFTKKEIKQENESKLGNLGNLGNLYNLENLREIKYIEGHNTLPTLPTLPQSHTFEPIDVDFPEFEGGLDD